MSDNLLSDLTTVSVSIENHIAHIQLNRPEKLNCMSPAFWEEFPKVVKEIDRQAEARVIVISSTGPHFSAGMDLDVFAQIGRSFEGEPARRAERLRRTVLELQAAFNVLETCRLPVIACVQGGAIGAGLDLLCACDIRYCTEDAFFSIKETQIGMTADVGTLQRLPHLMPAGIVREMAFTGRDLHAQEAVKHGFVNGTFADQASLIKHVMKLAASIAMNSPVAVTGCKEMLNYARDHSVNDSLNYIATWQSGMFQMPDLQEALTAQQEKRMPSFEPLHPNESTMTK
ncbi:crotonase/enoyl-CoA hydratase family protein [Aestuariibacter sp. AA17]|uniref:Crotonase/enoyl-CoA hydratase family protein n=1 Tax=Fluctibacter corallii TaxID=2984329 RepID=A0ABT3A8V4_9ALTE|nr:crotonase/enoyl-CoA hydratase family protein [Aestuariibacter sp. AA17]MCV2885119.1 crotonase/enoyl-CoA hydratase family protein [Aestuariibacter sp. AA17]